MPSAFAYQLHSHANSDVRSSTCPAPGPTTRPSLLSVRTEPPLGPSYPAHPVTMSENLAVRWMYRYKVFFLLGLFILGLQIFLAYKSFEIPDLDGISISNAASVGDAVPPTHTEQKRSPAGNANSASDDEDPLMASQQQAPATSRTAGEPLLIPEQLGFQPPCEIAAKEAISALQRAKTEDCRKHIAGVACAIQAGDFYAHTLPSHCPAGNRTTFAPLGCYRDEKEYRLLAAYFTNFKSTNTPARCTQLCLQSGYPYAGVQYGSECFCGTEAPPVSVKLADSKCNMKCSGDAKEICGGYFTMNVFETGITKFSAKIAETSVSPEMPRIRIAFLLTLNGRALRQVRRLLKALYSPEHVFYIHVDARQDYLYRKLMELESRYTNIRLARHRFSTIWGGASLLTMLQQCMADLLASTWRWDFVINLSESDFPVKKLEKLEEFLTANKGRNFVKSHGRETQRFIQKQGLDKTFVECDTHMWRIGDRQLPHGIQVDGGSDWVALSRPFVEYVTEQAATEPLLQGLLTIFRHTLLPAESFFHTVLRNTRFCDTYIDNNLHVTNWKRKLGCKCQYKHVVDWCGCSPNDFKPEDWSRLQNTEAKLLFFARKFEPIINQAIILRLEEWLFGAYPPDYQNLHAYWQSLYDAQDASSVGDDLTTTIGESLMRISAVRHQLKPTRLLEITHFLHQDQYKGFMLRYEAVQDSHNGTFELETRIRPVQYVKIARNSKFAKRLRNLEVSSDFDPKEQVSRNLAKFLGPRSEPVLSFTFIGGGAPVSGGAAHSYNLTLLWIDPTGQLQDFAELHIEDTQTDAINFSKALLKSPLTPGIWTVKMIGRAAIYAQVKFLVAPLAMDGGGVPLSRQRAQKVNGGSGRSLSDDFVMPAEWRQHLLSPKDVELLQPLTIANGERLGADLLHWIDELVAKFFQLRESCASSEEAMNRISTEALHSLPLCRETPWSSMAPDPKSDVEDLRRRS